MATQRGRGEKTSGVEWKTHLCERTENKKMLKKRREGRVEIDGCNGI